MGLDAVDAGETPLLRTLIEAVAAQLGMDRGRWRAEFIFKDGELREYYRHEERIPAGALDAAEPPTG